MCTKWLLRVEQNLAQGSLPRIKTYGQTKQTLSIQHTVLTSLRVNSCCVLSGCAGLSDMNPQ